MRAAILWGIAIAWIGASCNQSDFKGSSAKIRETHSKTFTQKSYPERAETFTQAFSGATKTETFDQGSYGALDLLVVVDNSGSMQQEQQNLSSKLGPLLSEVSNADWRIKVVTTDPADGCQGTIIDKGDSDKDQRFAQAVNAGVQGTGIERGILQSVEGLRCNRGNWVRQDSSVAVLIVSDEDNCHIDENQGYGCQGQPDRDADFLLDYLSQIRTLGEDARVYGLVWHPEQAAGECSSALSQATTYAELFDATGSTGDQWGSICDDDYTSTLKAISEDVSKILTSEYDLAKKPDSGTLAVSVNGETWEKFEPGDQSVTFTEPPPFGSKVSIEYTFGKTGELAKEFELDHEAVANSVQVTVNGEKRQTAFDENANKIVFDEPPKDKAKVEIDYKQKVDLKTKFSIDPRVDAKTVNVIVDDKVRKDFDVDAEKGVVTMDPPPPADATLRIEWKNKPET